MPSEVPSDVSSDVPSEVPSEVPSDVSSGVSSSSSRSAPVARRAAGGGLVRGTGRAEDRRDQVVLPLRAVALEPELRRDLVEIGERAVLQLFPVQDRHSGGEP